MVERPFLSSLEKPAEVTQTYLLANQQRQQVEVFIEQYQDETIIPNQSMVIPNDCC